MRVQESVSRSGDRDRISNTKTKKGRQGRRARTELSPGVDSVGCIPAELAWLLVRCREERDEGRFKRWMVDTIVHGVAEMGSCRSYWCGGRDAERRLFQSTLMMEW